MYVSVLSKNLKSGFLVSLDKPGDQPVLAGDEWQPSFFQWSMFFPQDTNAPLWYLNEPTAWVVKLNWHKVHKRRKSHEKGS